MKIALIIERFNPQAGGAEKSTAQIARHLTQRGHEVTVITWWSPDELETAGYKIDAFTDKHKMGMVNIFRFSYWVRQHLAEGDYDASLSMTTAAAATVVEPRSGTIRETLDRNVAMRPSGWSRIAKRLLIYASPKSQLQLRLERKTLFDPMVKRIVAVSAYVADQLRRHYGQLPDIIDVIPNASDMPSFSSAQRSTWRQTVRQGFAIDSDTPTFLFAAHNPKLKGAVTVLRAVRRLKEQGQSGIVIIAGQLSYALQRQAAQWHIRDRIRFTGTTDKIAQLMCAADVTVHPTWYDPSSKVVIESLMMGVPAISTRFNGASEWIASEGAGVVLSDPSDDQALAQAMVQLADPAQRAASTPANGHMAQALSMAQHVSRLEQLLEQVRS